MWAKNRGILGLCPSDIISKSLHFLANSVTLEKSKKIQEISLLNQGEYWNLMIYFFLCLFWFKQFTVQKWI